MAEVQDAPAITPEMQQEDDSRRAAIIARLEPQPVVAPPSAPSTVKQAPSAVAKPETGVAKPEAEAPPSVTMAPSKPFSLPAEKPQMPVLAPDKPITPSMLQPKTAAQPNLPQGRHAGIPGTVDPTTGQAVPYTSQERLNPFAGMFAHSENIGNPFLRTLAKIGSTIGGAAQGVTDAFNPEQKDQRMKQEMLPMEEAKTKAEVAQKNAAAQQTQSQAKVNEQAASHDLFPVRNQDGTVTFQKVERNLTPEEFARLTPDQQVSYAGMKSLELKGTPEGDIWSQRADQAKVGAQASQKPTVVAPENQPVAAPRVDQLNKEIGNLPLLSPDQRKQFAPTTAMTAGQAEKQLADARALSEQLQKEQDRIGQQGDKDLQTKVKALRPPIQKSYDSSDGQLDKLDQAKTELGSGNAGQAVGVVKTLSGLASGAGSGVRITGAELNMLVHNTRGTAGDLDAVWNKLTGGQNIVLNKDQITAMNNLIDHVKSHLTMKRDVADVQLHAIDTATTKEEAVKASDDYRRYMKAIEQNKAYTRTEAEAQATKRGISYEDAVKLYKKEGGVEVPE